MTARYASRELETTCIATKPMQRRRELIMPILSTNSNDYAYVTVEYPTDREIMIQTFAKNRILKFVTTRCRRQNVRKKSIK